MDQDRGVKTVTEVNSKVVTKKALTVTLLLSFPLLEGPDLCIRREWHQWHRWV